MNILIINGSPRKKGLISQMLGIMREGNFYDGWMKNPMSAMLSCNDGFRPFSFYVEAVD